MPRIHRPSPPEFRAEVVRLARRSDKSLPAPVGVTGCGGMTPTGAGASPATSPPTSGTSCAACGAR